MPIIINAFEVEPHNISRSPSGEPRVESQTRQHTLYLATRADDGSYLLETWQQNADGTAQRVHVMTDADALADEIRRAVRDLAGGI